MSRKSILIAAGLLVLLSVAGAALVTGNSADSGCSDCPKAVTCAAAKVPVVEASKCNGCTRCTVVAPNTFGMTADGSKAKVINAAGDTPEVIKSAAEGCKPRAITYR